jgi:aspartate kinase
VEGIRNVAGILKQHAGKKIVVVISASGKTTNHLEVVMNAHFNQTDGIESALAVVKDHHKMLMDGLFSPHDAIYDEVAALYSEISWITAQPRSKDYDFIYDQLVSLGNCYPHGLLQPISIEVDYTPNGLMPALL